MLFRCLAIVFIICANRLRTIIFIIFIHGVINSFFHFVKHIAFNSTFSRIFSGIAYSAKNPLRISIGEQEKE